MALISRTAKVLKPYILPASDEWDGNDGAWSTFRISIGNPSQDFRVLVSTSGYETWVPTPEACGQDSLDSSSPQICASARGVEPFNGMASSGFQMNRSSTWELIGLYDLGLGNHLNYSGNGVYGYDRVRLGGAQTADAISIEHQVVAGFATKDYYLGLLGVGLTQSSFSSLSEPIPSILSNLNNQSMIPSMAYGYTAGAQYRYRKTPGSLVLGGFDQSRFKPLRLVSGENAKLKFKVGIQSILVSDTLHGQGTISMSLEEGHLSVIDSTVPHIWLPEKVCDRFADAFGLNYDPTSGLYLVNSTTHDRLHELNATVTFKIGQNLIQSRNSTTISLPYSALDLKASSSYVTNTSYYFPIRRAANDSQHVIGRALLQEAYLVVDNERGNFTIAQTIFSDPLPAPDIVTIKSPKGHEGPKLGNGTIAGIVISSIIGFAALLAVFFCLYRRCKRQQDNNSSAQTGVQHYVDDYEVTEAPRPLELDNTCMIAEVATPANDHGFDNNQMVRVYEME